MSSSADDGALATPGDPAARERVLVAVNEFYEANPFPGFDPGKYETRQDLTSKDGFARSATVGRSKIEKRPMILIEAEASGQRISTLLQNAETIKLVGGDGMPRPVTDLKAGDEVLVHLEESARHFGMKIEESIVEK